MGFKQTPTRKCGQEMGRIKPFNRNRHLRRSRVGRENKGVTAKHGAINVLVTNAGAYREGTVEY